MNGHCIPTWFTTVVLSSVIGAAAGVVVADNEPVSTTFAYQGRLMQAGEPVSGPVDLVFRLYDTANEGAPLGELTADDFPIGDDGTFTIDLDFGPNMFTGGPRWLEIEVNEITLAPRQPIMPTPQAMVAGAISGAVVVPVKAVVGHYGGITGVGTLDSLSVGGKVGIGTPPTSYPLEIVAPASQIAARFHATSGGNGLHVVTEGGGNGINIWAEGAGNALYASAAPDWYAGYFVGGRTYFERHVGIGTNNPSHPLTIQNVTGIPALRLIGPNSFGHGARFNFGDADYVFLEEIEDDHLHIHAWNGTRFSTSLGEIVRIRGANVGIGTSSPLTSRRLDVRTPTSTGIWGETTVPGGDGVWGVASASSGAGFGIRGHSNSPSGVGVYGFANAPAHAMYALGNFTATGTKSFQIDHPLDPENKLLNHFCAESSEPLNMYSGNVVLDAFGEAQVELPEWFESINRDFRYQLTCIGAFAPVYIAREIENNVFHIAGGLPGMKVSWRIEAVRNDLYVREYGAPVEIEKMEAERGRYLHPELFGEGPERAMHHRPDTETEPVPALHKIADKSPGE